ncbi:hypothetical protein DSCO28_59370 [Desulfosarcina ovata subsp. sediminis]|uniref:Uncharacterized protein n=1 Tax=Desulfosarcina ovata subsp. sediminis TaxID=885957 RepID=A0A5K7ZZ10_9BACT|nr:hypothetical protein DSCO28_59370 [Desulfosarcina ovata subsp. sediminis]
MLFYHATDTGWLDFTLIITILFLTTPPKRVLHLIAILSTMHPIPMVRQKQPSALSANGAEHNRQGDPYV